MQQEEDVTLNTVEVPDGQRASLTLSDGTKVWLNSQSKLTYPTRFSENDRNVKLEGEAFFEVTHNGRVPFIVHSSLMDIKVLGTRFNVKVYTNEVAFVTLAEGKVEIATTDNENKLTLKPHEQASYSKEGGLNLVKQVDTEAITSWTDGEMCFVNRRLDEIVKDLERHFEVKITIRDSRLAAELFSCRFKESTSINQVLNLLKETRNLDYSTNGNIILLYYPK
ncbi:MAG: FecR domain-containing protein [Tannerellaceae bacterium]